MKETGPLSGRRIAIVVLGDVGRSPRMQYHTLSLLEAGALVSVVGYAGEALLPQLQSHRGAMDLKLFTPFEWPWLKRSCWPIFAALKAFVLLFQLAAALLSVQRPDLIIVQNPPAIPTIPVVFAVSFFLGCPFLVDWHNLGYTMMALALGGKRSRLRDLVSVYRAVEMWCAGFAAGHLCVTTALRSFLKESNDVAATTFHDRPPSFFAPPTAEGRHELMLRLKAE